MILFLAILLSSITPTIEDIKALKAKEEKVWIADQKAELALLKDEKKRIQEEIRGQKKELQKISLDILDKKARGVDIFPAQIKIQRNLYFLEVIEEEIDQLTGRIHRGLFGELLARKCKEES